MPDAQHSGHFQRQLRTSAQEDSGKLTQGVTLGTSGWQWHSASCHP